MKVCIRCDEVKPLRAFYRSGRCTDGYRNVCRSCDNRRRARRREEKVPPRYRRQKLDHKPNHPPELYIGIYGLNDREIAVCKKVAKLLARWRFTRKRTDGCHEEANGPVGLFNDLPTPPGMDMAKYHCRLAQVAFAMKHQMGQDAPEVDWTASKECPGCGEMKAAAEYGANRAQRDGLQSRCRVCHNERRRAG